MLAQIIDDNGTKKIVPLTADTGTGAPVGSYLYLEKKSNPQGYLYCDGSTFDETVYPALYQYLGTNVLPDWREFSAVGAEQNTTNVYDAQTNPNGVIHDHDVFTQGQAKDDCFQNHHHGEPVGNYNSSGASKGYVAMDWTGTEFSYLASDGRNANVTRGKSRAVFIYIKATSGLTENQQENVLNTINENLSYSTTEHKTGRKWIDGKDIYSKVIDFGALPNATSKYVQHNVVNLDHFTKVEGIAWEINNNTVQLPYVSSGAVTSQIGFSTTSTNISVTCVADYSTYTKAYFILEYTKTTD